MLPRVSIFALRTSIRTNTTTSSTTRRYFQSTPIFKMAAIVDTVKKTVAENFGVDAYVVLRTCLA